MCHAVVIRVASMTERREPIPRLDPVPVRESDLQPDETSNHFLAVWWTFIYALNLIVPLFLCSMIVMGAAKIGMTCGILAAWGVGLAICILRGPWRRALLTGSVITAISQFLPVAQIFAGSYAIQTWRWFTGSGDRATTFADGFAITIFTAQIMFVVALVIGWPIIWAREIVRPVNTTESSNTPAVADTDD